MSVGQFVRNKNSVPKIQKPRVIIAAFLSMQQKSREQCCSRLGGLLKSLMTGSIFTITSTRNTTVCGQVDVIVEHQMYLPESYVAIILQIG